MWDSYQLLKKFRCVPFLDVDYEEGIGRWWVVFGYLGVL